jgi:hypothetical protein
MSECITQLYLAHCSIFVLRKRSILSKPLGTSPKMVQIVRQRVIVTYALDTGQRPETAESLLHALEKRLGLFEKHREQVLDQLKR